LYREHVTNIYIFCIFAFADAEFGVYEKDVLLKLPHKEYILHCS